MNEPNDSKFVTRKWEIDNDQSNSNHDIGNKIIYKVFKLDLCDYNGAYILVKCDITVTAARAIEVWFKNCAPFNKCIKKKDGIAIDDPKNLDLTMPIYNLIEYSSNILK